ncbi:MAG: STAS domain-containing protein [Woeseiaceae bacterium]|nr:STAS domain-containing protein [Woeseiaceae bacterium]
MNIPILKLRGVLLASIQIDLIDQDALEFQANVLNKVRESGALGIIIDITALDVVDSFLARILNETANMVRLLGTESVICGMQPSVAITLVEMGRELIGVETALNLDMAMDKVEDLIAKKFGDRG